MSIESRLMKPGSWSVTLLPETPPGELEPILRGSHPTADLSRILQSAKANLTRRGFFGHILVLPTWVPAIGRSDANMLSMASYTGVVERIGGGRGTPYTISGGDLSRWLDYSRIESPLQFTDGTFTQWVTAIIEDLPGGPGTRPLQVGTITEPPLPYGGLLLTWGTGGENLMMTHREALDFVMLWWSAEYRVNPDGTVDAGPPATLFPTNPSISIRDTFHHGGDAAVLGSAHTGQAWTAAVGTWGIVSNQAKLTTSTSHGLATLPGTVSNFILTVTVDVSTNLGGTEIGIPFRIEDSSNYLLLHIGDGINQRVILQKRVAGTYSNLALSESLVFGVGDVLKFSIHAIDSQITVYLNDDLFMTYTLTAAEYAQFGDETDVGLWTDGPVDDGVAAFMEFLLDDLSQQPVALASRKTAGNDPNITGLATSALGVEEDIEEYSTRIVVTVSDPALGTLPAGSASVPYAIPYMNLFGGSVVKTKVRDTPELPTIGEEVPAQPFADELIQKEGRIRRQVKVDTDDYHIVGTARDGDMIYVFDPELGLVDTSTRLYYRGEAINPMKLRLYALNWPLKRGMGVYFRPPVVDPTYLDLTPWVEWEDAQGTADTTSPDEILTITERKLRLFDIIDRNINIT